MAKQIVGRDQQADVRRRYPKPAYSRIVSLQLVAAAVWGPTYVVTPPLGNKIWLLGIHAWVMPKAVNAANITTLGFMTGTTKPSDVLDIAKWENLLPLISKTTTSMLWYLHDGRDELQWKMMRLFTGTHRRFAVIATRIGAEVDSIQVSFEISEG